MILIERFKSNKIILKPEDPSVMDTPIECEFSAKGELVLNYAEFGGSFDDIGDAVMVAFEDCDATYPIQRSLLMTEMACHRYLENIGDLLGVTQVNYKYDIEKNIAAMHQIGFPGDDLGRVIHEEYLSFIKDQFERETATDHNFAASFMEHFTSHTITIGPTENPASMISQLECSFAADGHLEVVYKCFGSPLDGSSSLLQDALTVAIGKVKNQGGRRQSVVAKSAGGASAAGCTSASNHSEIRFVGGNRLVNNLVRVVACRGDD